MEGISKRRLKVCCSGRWISKFSGSSSVPGRKACIVVCIAFTTWRDYQIKKRYLYSRCKYFNVFVFFCACFFLLDLFVFNFWFWSIFDVYIFDNVSGFLFNTINSSCVVCMLLHIFILRLSIQSSRTTSRLLLNKQQLSFCTFSIHPFAFLHFRNHNEHKPFPENR
jgi:hypothetical protein